MSLSDHIEKKPKRVAFNASNSDSISQHTNVTNDSYYDTLSMLAKNFGRIMRRFDKRKSNNSGQLGVHFNRDKTPQGYKLGTSRREEIIMEMVNRTKANGFNAVSVKALGTYRLNAPII